MNKKNVFYLLVQITLLIIIIGCSNKIYDESIIEVIEVNHTANNIDLFIDFFMNNSNNSRYIFSVMPRQKLDEDIIVVNVERYENGVFYGRVPSEGEYEIVEVKKEDVINDFIFDSILNFTFSPEFLEYELTEEEKAPLEFINQTSDKKIIVNDTEITTDLELIWQGSRLLVVISKETENETLKSMHTSIIITPRKAIELLQKIYPKLKISNIGLFLIDEGDYEVPHYKMEGTNYGKIFSKIPVSYRIKLVIDAESGVIRSTERPFWSYFVG